MRDSLLHKKYEIVNHYLSNVGDLPPNLHMIFSAWVDLKMVNPFHLPEAHVLYRDGTTTAREDAKSAAVIVRNVLVFLVAVGY